MTRLAIPFSLLILTSLVASAQKIVTASTADKATLIGKSVLYLEDSSASLSLDEILLSDYQKKFQKVEKDVFTSPASNSAIWFKIQIQNKSGKEIWLSAGANAGWYLDFYRKSENDSVYQPPVLTGELRPATNKEFDSNFYWFRLSDKNDTLTHTYYLRHETGLAKEVPFYVGTIESLVQYESEYDFLSAAFIGLTLVMLFYNLFLAFATRETIYLSYVGYLISTGLVITYANGYPLLKGNFWLENFFVWSPILQFAICLFSTQYLRLSNNAPVLNKIIWAFALYCSIVVPLISLSGATSDLIGITYHLGMFSFYFLLLYAGIYLFAKRKLDSTYYLLGWFSMILSYLLFFGTILGSLPYNLFTRNIIYFGTGLEIIFFSIALANRLNTLKKEKEQAQMETIKHFKERNLWLEDRVAERTAEIHHRVKNNLQMIASMLNMQQRRIPTDSDKTILDSARNRVKSIGLIYEHLYSQDNLTEINIKSYIQNLTEMLTHNLNQEKEIDCHFDLTDQYADVDVAIPLGLIINELVTNSIKHAFHNHSDPKLWISLVSGKEWKLKVRDNGKGTDKANKHEGFGNQIVKALLDNLEGTMISTDQKPGFEVEIVIPNKVFS